ncbi:MAG: T9SS type A sorting domain-containing protein, partial [Chitinophagaceae bacterium]
SSSTLSPGDHIAVEMFSYDPCAMPSLVQSNEIVLDNPLDIVSIGNWEGSVNLYPNPNTGNFSIDAVSKLQPGQRISIVVLNMVGQRVYQSEIAPGTSKWSVNVRLNEGLANGLYTLQLNAENMRAVAPFVLAR